MEDPVAAAEWYVAHLGMTIKRAHKDRPWVRFIADDGGAVMLEFYNNPKLPVPDYRKQDALAVHIAFKVQDLYGERDRLVKAGATQDGDVMKTVEGDELIMLRDPWGVPIQLATRVQQMI